MGDNRNMVKIPVLEHDKVSRYLEAIQYNLLAFGCWEQQGGGQCYDDVLGHFKFIYIAEGNCTVVVNGAEYYPKCGDIILFSPFVPYKAICPQGEVNLKFYYLHFDVDPAEKRNLLTMLLCLKDIAIYQGLMSAPFIGSIALVYEHASKRYPGCYYHVGNLLRSTVMATLTASAPQVLLGLASENAATNEELIIRSCVEYIDANINQPILVEDLCRHVNVSQSYLYKCFSSVLNISTKDFIMEHKLRHLTIKLLKDNCSLKELAYNYGFSSVNHLSTVFKKYYGCPPTTYKKENLGNDTNVKI